MQKSGQQTQQILPMKGIRMSPELIERIERVGRRERRTFSSAARELILSGLEQREQPHAQPNAA